MQIKGLKRLKTFCDRLGIKTLGQLEDFYNLHKLNGEAVISTLERLANQ